MFRPQARVVLTAATLLTGASIARAQWTVVHLGPSRALGIAGGQIVGENGSRAALWTGSQESYVDLGPGSAVATDGVQQVGNLPGPIPALWTGTSASFVDLRPPGDPGYPLSVTGVDAGMLIGAQAHQISLYAVYWTTTPPTFGYLHPPGVLIAVPLGIHAGQQAGYYRWSTSDHACVWAGSAATFLDIHPAGFTQSRALGVHSGTQVGWVQGPGSQQAALWNGTAASYTDLHPAGAAQSVARAAFGPYQVGEAWIGGVPHASLWMGTAASWVDLDAYLPASSAGSVATGVWADGSGTIQVCGYRSGPGPEAGALLWKSTTSSSVFCSGDGSGTSCPCGNAGGAGNGCRNSLYPAGAHLEVSGIASVTADSLVLTGSAMPNSSVLYFQGTGATNGGLGSVFGDGLRCAGGTIRRLGTKTNAWHGSRYPGPGDVPISIRGLIPAGGGTRTYQAWYRNVAGPCGSVFNLTNGVSVAWSP